MTPAENLYRMRALVHRPKSFTRSILSLVTGLFGILFLLLFTIPSILYGLLVLIALYLFMLPGTLLLGLAGMFPKRGDCARVKRTRLDYFDRDTL